jgi:hypothetical protein
MNTLMTSIDPLHHAVPIFITASLVLLLLNSKSVLPLLMRYLTQFTTYVVLVLSAACLFFRILCFISRITVTTMTSVIATVESRVLFLNDLWTVSSTPSILLCSTVCICLMIVTWGCVFGRGDRISTAVASFNASTGAQSGFVSPTRSLPCPSETAVISATTHQDISNIARSITNQSSTLADVVQRIQQQEERLLTLTNTANRTALQLITRPEIKAMLDDSIKNQEIQDASLNHLYVTPSNSYEPDPSLALDFYLANEDIYNKPTLVNQLKADTVLSEDEDSQSSSDEDDNSALKRTRSPTRDKRKTRDTERQVHFNEPSLNPVLISQKKRKVKKAKDPVPLTEEQKLTLSQAATIEDLKDQLQAAKDEKKAKTPTHLSQEEQLLSKGDLEKKWQEERHTRKFGERSSLMLNDEEKKLTRSELARLLSSEANQAWAERLRSRGIQVHQCTTCGRQVQTNDPNHFCARASWQSPLQRRSGIPQRQELIVTGSGGGFQVQKRNTIDEERLNKDYENMKKMQDRLAINKESYQGHMTDVGSLRIPQQNNYSQPIGNPHQSMPNNPHSMPNNSFRVPARQPYFR